MRRSTAGFLALIAIAPGCKKKDEPAPVAKVEPAVEAAVAAPEGLVAEAIVRSPDALVASFRVITPIVPDKAAPLLADAMHVGRETTDEVDGTRPAYFVTTRKGPTESGFVFAVQLKSAAKVLDALAKQGLARTEDSTQALSIFEAGQAAKGPKGQVLGVRKGYLLAASSVSALKELAGYATRTLPTRPAPTSDVAITIPQSAMRGALRDAFGAVVAAAAAQRKLLLDKPKGDAGAPQAVGAMDAIGAYSARTNERIVGWLADAGEAHVNLTAKDGALSLRADVEIPNAESPFGKAIAGWQVGSALTVLAAPSNALLAFGGRTGDAARAESSRDLAEILATMYPDDVTAKERAKVEEFLSAWDKARDDAATGALLYEGPARLAVAARLGAKDPAALAKLTKDAFTTIFAMKGVASGLGKQGIGVSKFTEATIAGVRVDVLSLNMPKKPGEKPKPGEPETADVVFGPAPGGRELAVVAGVGARELFATFVEAKGDKNLEAFSPLKQQVEKLGPDLSGVALGLPSRMIPLSSGAQVTTPAPPNDPVLVAVGRSAKGPFVVLDVSRAAVELAGRFAIGTMMKK